MKVYCAGPLFTPYEREFMSRCGQALRDEGINAFVPHESPKEKVANDTRGAGKRVFDNDFAAIAACNAMLAVVNGPEVDDGTACEIGVFWALAQTDAQKVGVVALQQDWRTQDPPGEGKGLNSFVLGCVQIIGTVCHSLEEAVAQIKTWQAELERMGGQPCCCGTEYQPCCCGTEYQPCCCGTEYQPRCCGTEYQPRCCGTDAEDGSHP